MSARRRPSSIYFEGGASALWSNIGCTYYFWQFFRNFSEILRKFYLTPIKHFGFEFKFSSNKL
jgi:hypothetical protein